MATSLNDFQVPVAGPGKPLAAQWEFLVRAVQGLGAVFAGKESLKVSPGGDEPLDYLRGFSFADEADKLRWQIYSADASVEGFEVRWNRGTDGTPIWVTKLRVTQHSTSNLLAGDIDYLPHVADLRAGFQSALPADTWSDIVLATAGVVNDDTYDWTPGAATVTVLRTGTYVIEQKSRRPTLTEEGWIAHRYNIDATLDHGFELKRAVAGQENHMITTTTMRLAAGTVLRPQVNHDASGSPTLDVTSGPRNTYFSVTKLA